MDTLRRPDAAIGSRNRVTPQTLALANAVVDSAVSTWGLAPRALRLGLTTLRYTPPDLLDQELWLLVEPPGSGPGPGHVAADLARRRAAVVTPEPRRAPGAPRPGPPREGPAHRQLTGERTQSGDAVGLLALEPVPGDPALHVHGLYVHAAWQRRGLGEELVALAAHRARRHGYTALSARVWRHARTFFHVQGFRTVGDPGASPVQMRRPLA